MLENQVNVIITLSDPELKEKELQRAVQNLQLEADKIQGVEANLISISEAPPGSKGLGDFLVDKFKALVDLKKLQNLLQTLSHRLIGKQIIEVEVEVEDKKKKLKVKIGSPEDFAKIMSEINKFVNGQEEPGG